MVLSFLKANFVLLYSGFRNTIHIPENMILNADSDSVQYKIIGYVFCAQ